MQRKMKLIGTKPYAYDIDDQTYSGTTCYFMYDDSEISGHGTYCGNFSDVYSSITPLEVGADYIVVTDRAQGRLLGLMLF